jgi:hypothetical protein
VRSRPSHFLVRTSHLITAYLLISIRSGVFLKWLSLDHLYVTTTGRLLIGSLTGAVLASSITKEDSVTSDGVVESDARLKAKAKKGGEAIKRRGDKESSSGIPSNSYYCVAPEVLLGGSPSPESTVYTAGSICAQILTGKTVIKVDNFYFIGFLFLIMSMFRMRPVKRNSCSMCTACWAHPRLWVTRTSKCYHWPVCSADILRLTTKCICDLFS